jgi:hypothetical protein
MVSTTNCAQLLARELAQLAQLRQITPSRVVEQLVLARIEV